jgi:peroxiredoxin Q/BCP
MLSNGDAIPNVSIVDETGAEVLVQSLVDRPIVLYFYPKDGTPGCTREACGFRDAYEDFIAAGADVIGVSSDAHERHARFRARHNLPFRLFSDPHGQAAEAFGVGKTLGVLPGRVTFVIVPPGKILYTFSSQFQPQEHIAKALRALRTRAAHGS